jgi:hypothetical protein
MAAVGKRKSSSQRQYVPPVQPTTFQLLQHPRLVSRPAGRPTLS